MRVILSALLATFALFSHAHAATPAAHSAAYVARDTACAPDFAAMEAAVRRDYPGTLGMAPDRAAAMERMTDSVRAEAERAVDDAACLRALQRWVAFFRDNHLQVWQPSPPRPASVEDVIVHRDADKRPVRFPDDSSAVLWLPSFGRDQKARVDSLVAEHRARLLATPYLLIDVRGNGGGWTAVYESLLPLLYTGPIRVHGMDIYASPGNLAMGREMVASGRAPPAMLEQARAVLARMEASPGEMVVFSEDTEIRLDTVQPMPRRVAVLVDGQCASSCEQFVLDARQSRKVTVLGTRATRGMLDYGNARQVPLPSGIRRFQMPAARSRRLPAQPLDATGLAPEVLIPADHPDPVAFALDHLRRNGPSTP